jgi:hypothetical protein
MRLPTGHRRFSNGVGSDVVEDDVITSRVRLAFTDLPFLSSLGDIITGCEHGEVELLYTSY